MTALKQIANRPGYLDVLGAPHGFDAFLLAAAAMERGGPVLFIARDEARAATLLDAVAFFAPDLETVHVPAWDCLPYDRLSPKPEVASSRVAALARLAARRDAKRACAIVTSIDAVLQRLAPGDALNGAAFQARPGGRVDLDALIAYLAANGFSRTGTVREPGEFAVRGGLVDLYPAGAEQALRLDFFGDTLETIRRFDPETQRTTGDETSLDLMPAGEVLLDAGAIERFRSGYVAAFGAVTDDDPLYEGVSAGRKHPGMEHFLPLFHERLETLFDYLPGAAVMLDHQVAEARDARLALIADFYDARVTQRAQAKAMAGPAYKPLPPERLYLTAEEWDASLKGRDVRQLSPFAGEEQARVIDAGGRGGRDFAPERSAGEINVFDATAAHVRHLQGKGKRVIFACTSAGSADRVGHLVADHGIDAVTTVPSFGEAEKYAKEAAVIAVLPLEHGFEAPGFAVITESDILGDRLIRSARRQKKAQNFLTEATALAPGDLVVHVEHGIGRYLGLKIIDAAGEPHDCLEVQYDGGKLFLPVENIELLSRFGSDSEGVTLDKLGGSGWQSRKAKLKNRIREIASELIRVAAARALRKAPSIHVGQGMFDEFCARFPYEETEDQLKAIGDVLEDLGRDRPMDRLVCGDVGFGKTEVALRAAFLVAISGLQVAIVAPTTLLARQHYRTFRDRFAGWPLKVRQLSRFVPAKDAAETRTGLIAGDVDVVIGTHALLAKSISFKRLGLLIIDEEQHFGVTHKERLKQLREDVHVLTLTATPIPRTLQLALSGVKELSIIATPPVDRLAVRTFVGPFDPLTVREALIREHYRGGQSFFVVPRIADLAEAEEFLKEQVPEIKVAVAHGQMPTGQLDDIMNAFYDGQYGILLSTTIVESGLDIPSANTMIVSRADMFGLAQLYQLRGRIGRSKQRAYCYLTTPAGKALTEGAERRLQVLQSLDTLGAGFQLASHDLDIRGAGNLLGDEQSGHIREVGFELYQEMLEEAVAQLRAGGGIDDQVPDQWSPQINIGAAVLIPEAYVPDLDVRMALYRRLADVEDEKGIEAFAAELIDRFGPLPDEVKTLLRIVAIKRLCRQAGVEKIDAGPKGAIVAFRNNAFSNPAALVSYIQKNAQTVKVRPDQKLVIARDWATPDDRIKHTQAILSQLAKLAEAA